LYVSHLHRDHFDPDWLGRHMSKDADGPLGDSGLAVDDGSVRIYNQNDSRPVEAGPIEEFGSLHGHFLQYSGAIWYPIVFPDQFVFLEYLAEQGADNAHLFLTGTSVELSADGGCDVEQLHEEEVARIRDDRRGYLLSYKRRVWPELDRILGALPQDRSDLVGRLRAWVQPLMETADYTCAGLNGRILLEVAAVDGGAGRVLPRDHGAYAALIHGNDRRLDTDRYEVPKPAENPSVSVAYTSHVVPS
jgi:hypothetical protein